MVQQLGIIHFEVWNVSALLKEIKMKNKIRSAVLSKS